MVAPEHGGPFFVGGVETKRNPSISRDRFLKYSHLSLSEATTSNTTLTRFGAVGWGWSFDPWVPTWPTWRPELSKIPGERDSKQKWKPQEFPEKRTPWPSWIQEVTYNPSVPRPVLRSRTSENHGKVPSSALLLFFLGGRVPLLN